jgi:hypothetical protein
MRQSPACCYSRVQVPDVGIKSLADDERLRSGLRAHRRHRGGFSGSSQSVGQEGREQDRAAGLEQDLLENALQLADVAGPLVAAQALQRLRSNLTHVAWPLGRAGRRRERPIPCKWRSPR